MVCERDELTSVSLASSNTNSFHRVSSLESHRVFYQVLKAFGAAIVPLQQLIYNRRKGLHLIGRNISQTFPKIIANSYNDVTQHNIADDVLELTSKI